MSSSSIFTGSSHFSADFQSVISRTVAIASLPLRQMQTAVLSLQSQSTELTSLTSGFSALGSAIASLESSLSSYGSSVLDSEVVSAALTGTPLPATFSVAVIDLGTYATSMSNDGLATVPDAATASISDAGSFTLRTGAETVTIAPAGNTLLALAEAINLSPDANVQATVVNIGSAASPDYRLSLRGIQLGDLEITLTAVDGSNPGQILTTEQSEGAAATYRVNGQPATPISSLSRNVEISPGVNVTLVGQGTTDVTVSRSTVAMNAALTRFAAAYNAAQAGIDNNRGEGTGALHGQSILMTLTDGLHRISHYSSGRPGLASLASLGLSFDKAGTLSFDSALFGQATSGKIAQLASFMGSATGGGFLKVAAETMATLNGEDTGILSGTVNSLRGQIESDNQAVTAEEERIDRLRTQVEGRMAAADAAIAALEQQASYFSNMFAAMQQASRSYQ